MMNKFKFVNHKLREIVPYTQAYNSKKLEAYLFVRYQVFAIIEYNLTCTKATYFSNLL